MIIEVTDHQVPVVPPPKTYTVTFRDMTEDELVYLRASLSDGQSFRSQSGKEIWDKGYKGYVKFYQALDRAVPGLFNKMDQRYKGR